MVRNETLPFNDYALATPGQLTWVFLNQLIDYDERVRKIHVHCLPKFKQDRCEICGEPVGDVRQLPEHLQDQVYNPSLDGEIEDVKLDIMKPPMVEDENDEIEVEVE